MSFAMNQILRSSQSMPKAIDRPTLARNSQVLDLVEALQQLRTKESKSPFERISPHLFIRIIGLCDAKSLSSSFRVCSDWKGGIEENRNLFRNFQFDGGSLRAGAGIRFFNERCGGTLVSIDLQLNSPLFSQYNVRHTDLRPALLESVGTLKHLSISDHVPFISDLVDDDFQTNLISRFHCLESLRLVNHSELLLDFEPTVHHFPNSVRLKRFEWRSENEFPVFNDDLCSVLKDAKEVTIDIFRNGWHNIPQPWVLSLLSQASELEDLQLDDLSSVASTSPISFMRLPKLKNLYLTWVPSDEESADPRAFFNKFHAPNLQTLSIDDLNPVSLQSLGAGPNLKKFKCQSLRSSYRPQEAVKTLLESMKSWNDLACLEIVTSRRCDYDDELISSRFSEEFWIELCHALTVLARESIKMKGSDSIILPSLKELRFELVLTRQAGDSPSRLGSSLCSLVSSRAAAFDGEDNALIMSCANGFSRYHSSSKTSSNPSRLGIKSPLEKVWIRLDSIALDARSFMWLTEHVGRTMFCAVIPSSGEEVPDVTDESD